MLREGGGGDFTLGVEGDYPGVGVGNWLEERCTVGLVERGRWCSGGGVSGGYGG